MVLHWGGPELLGGNLHYERNAVTWADGSLDILGGDAGEKRGEARGPAFAEGIVVGKDAGLG